MLQAKSPVLKVAAPALVSLPKFFSKTRPRSPSKPLSSPWSRHQAVRLFAFILLLFLVLPAQAEEIYRCTLADGSVVFQDQKCRSGKSQVLRGDLKSGKISSRSLQEWLDADIAPAPANSARRQSRPVSRAPITGLNTLPRRPASEFLLSICSEQMLICTGDGLDSMDRCVAALPVCGAGRSQSCCSQAFVDRYRLIRASGLVQREAVRGALLGVAGE